MPDPRKARSRIVVDASARRQTPPNRQRQAAARGSELWIAISVIVAAALATFLALYITSRTFDTGTASLAPQQTVPAVPIMSPSARPSPAVSPTPQAKASAQQSPAVSGGEIAPVDDASIQSRIDSSLAADATLAKLDVSTLVENGKVTIVGSVRSAELKQRLEKAIRSIKGVTSVDNQLVINESTP